MFSAFKKKIDVSAVIQYRSDKDDEAAYEQEAKKAEQMMLSWFPKHLTVQQQKIEWNPLFDKSQKWEILLNGSVLVHTNVWMQEGFLSKAKAQKQEFIKAAIEGAMIGKLPQAELDTYKKEVNSWKKWVEATAMAEANDYATVAKKERLENEERVRKERAAKLVEIKRKESERQAAEAAEATNTPAVKKVTKAKSKPKAKSKTVKQSPTANIVAAPAPVKASTSDDASNTTGQPGFPEQGKQSVESTSAEGTAAAPSREAAVTAIQKAVKSRQSRQSAVKPGHKNYKPVDRGADAADSNSGITPHVDALTEKDKELKVLSIEQAVLPAMEPEPEPHDCEKKSSKKPQNALPAWAFPGFACCRVSHTIQDRAENDGPTFIGDDNLLIA